MSAAIYILTWSISLALLIIEALCQHGPGWTATPFNPPAFPLVVRSPYFNSWTFQGSNPPPLSNIWPDFWSFFLDTTAWYASAVVDQQAYRLLGRARFTNDTMPIAKQTATEFTSTRSSFILTAGSMQINVSFISPIEPIDLVRQSMPFSYLMMSASSLDGDVHNLRLYSDVGGQFISGDTSQLATWSAEVDDEYIVLSMQLETLQKYTQIKDIAMDSIEFFSFKSIDETNISWAISNDTLNRALAANASATLGNITQPPPRQIQDSLNNWTTLAIAVEWGEIQATPQPAVWTLGVVRSPSIQYTAPSGIQERHPYFMSSYSDGTNAAKAFLDDFPRAQAVAAEFDSRILMDGHRYSSEYADLLALSARQLMGSIDITISKDSEGNWNMSDVKVFMKNMDGIGSDESGTTMSVNTVDTLYAAFPAFLYLNPELGGYLLSPLLELQDSSEMILSYSARNIGSSYPNATADGIQFSHDYGVEESANMLIMTLAYSQRSGNGTLLGRHYSLLRKWADYLVHNAFNVENQKSADFAATSAGSYNNQTNLSLKGIIGIASMARIAEIARVEGDRMHFNDTATSYMSQWTETAVASDQSHVYFSFGDSSSTGLIYNLYADKLLQLDLATPSVYEAVTSSYQKFGGQYAYGMPLDNSQSVRTTTNGMMFAASTVTDIGTRDSMVNQIYAYASSNRNNTPFSSIYNPSTGLVLDSKSGRNSPACGAMFSLLALNTGIESSIKLPSEGSTIPDSAASAKSLPNVGAIVGGTIGGIALLLTIVITGFLYIRRRRRCREQFEAETEAEPVVLYHSPSSQSETDTLAPRGKGAVQFQNSLLRPMQQVDEKVAFSTSSFKRRTVAPESRGRATPAQESDEGLGSRSLLEPSNTDPTQLREDFENLRQELERVRQDLSSRRDDFLPSYSDAGLI